jgi:hypothetical protein
VDRREFLAVSGAALTGVAHDYLGVEPPRLAAALGGEAVGDALMCQIEGVLPALRDTDHRLGGVPALTYAHGQFLTVGTLLRDARHQSPVTVRLLTALAELGDVAGYMAFDAGRHGLAQRYWITALHAAHQASNRPLASSILGNLSYQASWRGDGRTAVGLGEAALTAAAQGPTAVWAAAASRLAMAHASADQEQEFRRTWARAREFLTARPTTATPAWADYVSPSYLEGQAAYALIRLGRARRASGKALLAEGRAVLAPSSARNADAYRRAGVLGTAWLALGHAAAGDVDAACEAGRAALDRISAVRSPRCGALLRTLRADLARGRHRNPAARELIGYLDAARLS